MEIMPVIKADAYGHGIVEISRILRKENADVLGVAFADEAMKLRKEGDTGDIFVLIPGTDYDAELYVAFNLQASVMDMHIIQKLSKLSMKRGIKVRTHLFINTGMNRDGIEPKDAVKFMNEAKTYEGIEMIGIMTHLASSELEDKSFSNLQLERFDNTLKDLNNHNYQFKKVHTYNSAAILNFPNNKYNLSRCGIGLYGYMDYPELAKKLDLKPVLTLKSKVININSIGKGDNVGYSLKYISDAEKRIAVVPLGYGDGFHRALSNKAQCLINGKKYQLVGAICMDQCLVDIQNDNIKINDEVVFIGRQGNEEISCFDNAKIMNTIPYEITTALKHRVPRIYID